MKDYFKKNKFNIVSLTVYAVISFVILLFHEPWRDEAQAWLISRDLNIFEIIKQLTYEGHPGLWYFILHFFSRLGFPYFIEKLISYGFCLVSAWIILKKAPFDKFLKILILLSSPMLYLYPSISRSYCLIPLSISLCAIYYKKRHDEPIKYLLSILLLANTHIVLYGLIGALIISFFIEEIIINRNQNSKEYKKKICIYCGIICFIIILICIPILISVIKNTDANVLNRTKLEFDYIVYRCFEVIISLIIDFSCGTSNIIIVTFLVFICIYLFTYLFFYNKKYFFILICTLVPQIYIYGFVYVASLQRAGIILFLILFFLWISNENDKKSKKIYKIICEIFIMIIFLLNTYNCYKLVHKEITTEYSSSTRMSNYINNNIEENSIIVCTNMPLTSAVIPNCINYKFWSPQKNDFFTFVTWDENYKKEIDLDKMFEDVKNLFKDKKIYLLYSYDFDEILLDFYKNNEYIEEIFKCEDSEKENYILYRIQ